MSLLMVRRLSGMLKILALEARSILMRPPCLHLFVHSLGCRDNVKNGAMEAGSHLAAPLPCQMYPLPQMPNKRHSRMGGQKMSGSVFTRLLNRVAAQGHDLHMPLDLKVYRAKHGPSRPSSGHMQSPGIVNWSEGDSKMISHIPFYILGEQEGPPFHDFSF